MHKPTWKILLALCLASPASALLVSFSFNYDRMTLRTGRELRAVTLKSYNTQTGKVAAVIGAKQLATFRIDELPEEVAARVRQMAPAQSAEEIRAEQRQAGEDLKAAKRRVQEVEQSKLAEAKADRAARRKLDVRKAEVSIEQEPQIAPKIAAAARQMATHYFTYEADPHSSLGYVFDSSVILDDPEPVPGWADRWRVRGKVGIQYLTRNMGAVGRSSKDFEVLIDAPPKGSPKLVEVTVSR